MITRFSGIYLLAPFAKKEAPAFPTARIANQILDPIYHNVGLTVYADSLAAGRNRSQAHEQQPDRFCFGDIRLDSHTNSLAALFDRFGAKMFADLRGDFSAVLFDREIHTLTLITDPLGVRPLYYCIQDRSLFFANSLERLLKLLPQYPELDQTVLLEYLAYRFDHLATQSFFSGVRRLPAGHLLTVEKGRLRLNRYFYPDPGAADDCRSADDFSRRYRELLIAAVRSRTPSDSRILVQVSGGHDSSSVAAITNSFQGTERNGSLANVSPEFPRESELAYQQAILAGCPELEPCFLDATRFVPFAEIANGAVPDLLEPENHPQKNWLRGNLQFASGQGVAAVLTGAGGDSLLGAHLNYAYPITLRDYSLRQLPGELRYFLEQHSIASMLYHALAVPCLKVVPGIKWGLSSIRKRYDLRRTPWVNRELYHARRITEDPRKPFPVSGVAARLTRDWFHLGSTALWHSVNQQLAERTGARFVHPFFDASLLEFMLCVPPELRMQRGSNKVIARRAMQDLLPESITNRFDSRPAAESITRGFKVARSQIEELFSRSLLVDQGYIDFDIWWNHWGQAFSGEPFDYQPLVVAINAECWLRNFVESREDHRRRRLEVWQEGAAGVQAAAG